MGRGSGERRPYARLGADERARFLAVLAQTGNRRAASRAIGIDERLMDQRREYDAALDAEWEAAVEEADRRLSGAQGPFGCEPVAGLDMIKRGKGGRLQMVTAGKGRWSAQIETEFLERLRSCGNVRAAARAVGFTEGTVWARRRQWPAFAEAMEAVLEEAELALEYRIACMGNNVGGGVEGRDGRTPGPSLEGRGEEGAPSLEGRGEEGASSMEAGPVVEPVAFDLDAAMRFLKWREEKRRGRGRWAPRGKPPSIEEVTEKLVRRVEAIKRHRALEKERAGEQERQ